MSIFGIIKSDDKVFTGDKFRIMVNESFLAPALTFATKSHEISLDNGVTWYDVSSKKQLDWVFDAAGTQTISLRISTTEPSSATVTKEIEVLDITTQNLFSNDHDLYVLEPDIDKYLPKSWSSWNLIHLKAQEYIMDWLNEKRIFKQDGSSFAPSDLLEKQEVKQFSVAKALEFIFEGNSNVVGDISSVKRDKYKLMANEKASRSQLALNYNGTTTEAKNGRIDMMTVKLNRR
mgnify:CR=1 FL=1